MLHSAIEYYPDESGQQDFFGTWKWENQYIFPHIHQYPEILYVISGEMTLILNGEQYRVPAGHGVFFLPYEVHSFTLLSESVTQHVMHSEAFVPDFFRKMAGDTVPTRRVIDLRNMSELFGRLSSLEKDDMMRIVGNLNLLYAEFWNKCGPAKGIRKETDVCRRLIDYVQTNYLSDVTLRSAAKTLGYHEKYLSAVLSRMTDMNFRTFLNAYRVEHFCRLSCREENRIKTTTALAAESGFSTVQTFNRIFRLLKGMTPGEYRTADMKR